MTKAPILSETTRADRLLTDVGEPTRQQKWDAYVTTCIAIPPGEERLRVLRALGLAEYPRHQWRRSRG